MKMGQDPIEIFQILGSFSLGITCGLLYALARLWVFPIVSGVETSVYQMLVVGAFTTYLLGLGYRPIDESGTKERGKGRGTFGLLGVSGFLIFLAA